MKRKSSKSQHATLIHEVNSTQHRIVRLHSDGTNEAGGWVGLHELADLGKFLAVVGESKLPQGIFTCSEHKHQLI